MAINARGQQHRHHKRDKKSPGENPGEERGKRRADQGGILKTNTEVKKEKEIDPDQGGKNREQGAGREEGEREEAGDGNGGGAKEDGVEASLNGDCNCGICCKEVILSRAAMLKSL